MSAPIAAGQLRRQPKSIAPKRICPGHDDDVCTRKRNRQLRRGTRGDGHREIARVRSRRVSRGRDDGIRPDRKRVG